MKVVIPLAGFGKRLRPHTYTKPKPLVNVAGKPVLGHILDKLKNLDIEEIIFIVGYLGEQIEQYVEATYKFHTRYIEQKELLGQAHAIYLAKDHVREPVLIIFVDTIFEADLKALAELTADGAIYVKEVDDPRRFGVVTLQDGFITRFVEKPSTPVSNLAVIGVYYIKDAPMLFECIDELIARNIQTQGEYFLADALQLMIERGIHLSAPIVDVWEDCGTVESLLRTNRYLLLNGGFSRDTKTEDYIIRQPVYISSSASISNSIIGPYVTIADDSKIENSIVKDSIVNEGASIEDAILTGSLIGSHARVKGSFKTLNVGDSSEIEIG